MWSRVLKVSCLYLGLLVIYHTKLVGQDLFDYDHSRKYAEHLFELGEYESAINEFNRCLFLDHSGLDGSLALKLLISYRKTERYEKVLDFVLKNYRVLQISDQIKDELHKSYILTNSQSLGLEILDSAQFDSPFLNFKYRSYYQFIARDISAVEKDIFQQSFVEYSKKKYQQDFQTLLTNYNLEKKKSPVTAGLLSAILPGLGKVYTNRIKDAFFSFFLTGISIYQAYRGFSKNGTDSKVGWVYGGLATGFYVGGVYGSAKSANVYNHQLEDKYNNEATQILNIDN